MTWYTAKYVTQQWTHTHTHTHREHTHTHTHPEQWAAINAVASGEQLGVQCLAQGHLSRGIEGGESAVYSLPPPTIPAGPRLELTTFRFRVWLSTTTSPTSPLCTFLHIVMLFYCFNKRALLIFCSMHPLVASGWKTVSFPSNRNYAF